jgi:HEAT repeat protein
MIGALLLFALLPAEPAQPADAAQLLKQGAAYRFGESREPLSRLSEMVRDSLRDPLAAAEMEKLLVGLLESDATPEAREWACRELRWVGTAASVPPLCRLLGDSRLGEAALFALSAIPASEASDALAAALAASSGRLRIGIIQSLAVRGVRHPGFVRLAADADRKTAAAATWALGKTGAIDDALEILARHDFDPESREAALAIAERAGGAGLPVFTQLLAAGEPPPVRVAALQGIVRLRGQAACPELAAALRSGDAPLQAEAIRLAALGDGVDLLMEAIPQLAPEARQRALTALAEAGAKRALPLMLAAMDAQEEPLRIAGLAGVGSLGGARHVRLLAERAATTAGAEQAAARDALSNLRGADVDAALVAELERADAGTKVELIRGAGQRDARSAAGALLAAASSAEPEVRVEALRALREIAPADTAPKLVRLLADARRDSERRETERALAAALRRNTGDPLAPVTEAYAAATTTETRAAIVSAVGQSGRDDALPFLRQALSSEDAALARAAVLALTEWPTQAPAPDLLRAARGAEKGPVPVLALRGYIRLVSTPSALAASEVAAQLAAALGAAWQAEERKAVLAALQKHPCPESLATARTLLEDSEVAAEAKLAVQDLERALYYRR